MARRKQPTYEQLEREYQSLWDTMAIKSSWVSGVSNVAAKIRKNKDRYEKISKLCGGNIPWQFIGVIHNLECSLSFNKHLHNGDSLNAKTRRVPRGRPKVGKAPYSFEESAVDALTLKGYDKIDNWSVPRMLYELERYNGWGYRLYHPSVLSPYLWSGTAHYQRGKYVSDGTYDGSAVSRQIGVAPLLKMLEVQSAPQTVSRKARTGTYLDRLFLGLGSGTLLSWQTLSDVRGFLNDNAGIIALGLGAFAFLTYKYFQYRNNEDLKEGRYIPSGVATVDDAGGEPNA